MKHIDVSDDSATRRFPRLWHRAKDWNTECQFAHTLNGAARFGRSTAYGRSCWKRIRSWRNRQTRRHVETVAGVEYEFVRVWTIDQSVLWQPWPTSGARLPLRLTAPSRRMLRSLLAERHTALAA